MNQPNWDQGLVHMLEAKVTQFQQKNPHTTLDKIALSRPTSVEGTPTEFHAVVEHTLTKGSELLAQKLGAPYQGIYQSSHPDLPGKVLTHVYPSTGRLVTEADVMYGWRKIK